MTFEQGRGDTQPPRPHDTPDTPNRVVAAQGLPKLIGSSVLSDPLEAPGATYSETDNPTADPYSRGRYRPASPDDEPLAGLSEKALLELLYTYDMGGDSAVANPRRRAIRDELIRRSQSTIRPSLSRRATED
ncbi:hypothetical protein EYC59_02650 [Candidatus Saccharibacteria bacterium]|nr:MAG: hypothetical protein EYC59_02650 [Candidatus Saccharibacteria bacterium]